MRFNTHIAFSLFIGLLILNYFDFENEILFLLFLLFFSIFPDIDEKDSKISRKTRWISWPIRLFFRHRGFFHSFFFPLLLFILFYFLDLGFLGLGILIGYLSHLFLDMLTISGLKFFGKRYKGFIKTGSFFELLIFTVFLVLDVWLIFLMLF